jgi:hypothetical protein
MQGILGGFGQNPSLSPAISSGCLVGITSEGDATGSTFRLPTGTNSSLLPMAVAVDIYPRKQTCTGSFIRKIFPFGISSQPLVGSSLLSGNGSQLRLFILD